jgi:NAD+ diphosphatase
MRWIPAHRPPKERSRRRRWFLFQKERILVRHDGGAVLQPYFGDVRPFKAALRHSQYLGDFDGIECFTAELAPESPLPAGAVLENVRRLLGAVDDDVLRVAGRANQLAHWARTHQYCGSCGTPTTDKTDERAKVCPSCGLVNYPRLTPAVIVAVVRQGRLLLARSRRIKGAFHSVLAGFVEPGETLEDAVRREVSEEVGIRLCGIRYFGSQPWPFPDALMVAFTAEHAAGEIAVDPAELIDAGWFAPDALPEPIPGKWSIARRLIDWFLQTYRR